jgi:WhiB family redox-sensing transcriptional regulator
VGFARVEPTSRLGQVNYGAWSEPEESVLDAFAQRPWWHAHGACRGVPVRWFFPERGEAWREAMEACEACTVQPWCLVAALTGHELNGIWGGYSERTRRHYRRKRTLGGVLADHAFVVNTVHALSPPEGWQEEPRLVLPPVASRPRTPEQQARLNARRRVRRVEVRLAGLSNATSRVGTTSPSVRYAAVP